MWYILRARQVVEVDEASWKQWLIENVHQLVLVRQEFWQQNTVVITAFVGLDITRGGSQPPKFFVTRVDGADRPLGRTYQSFEEAMHGHLEVCAQVRAL